MSRRLRLATIVGARPQFIKCVPFSRAWRQHHEEVLIHTGQHYDPGMSDIFFKQLEIPRPNYHLGIGGGSHGHQTGRMLQALDPLLAKLHVDGVLVYGDTNSTLAGALAAAKLGRAVFHVESGLRSYRKEMPEEINRVITDHLSALLFAPTPTAVQNLKREGLTQGVYQTGDIMLDAFRYYERKATRIRYRLPVALPYALTTVHRAESTAHKHVLQSICRAFERLPIPVLWPIHPRTRRALATFAIRPKRNVTLIAPVGYLESIVLQRNATVILTDSGGIQKEAYFLKKPCITLRQETEWVETVQSGNNHLAGYHTEAILRAFEKSSKKRALHWPAFYGDGHAAEAMVRTIERYARSA